jgi:hypothetical protein
MILQEERLKNEREEIDRLQKSTAEWVCFIIHLRA